ncbi:branched-chain amino acid ABC transporter permease [Haloglomus halophilum]|uniref:branched-chain amino acid ABC transporter permease n=1 Tax=Haloglomus halophilum TaxID=2962672 RepID=UPI0020C9D50D|nr:branched-chain amino acid ABC transporter permease [Haloglomus halophilum]
MSDGFLRGLPRRYYLGLVFLVALGLSPVVTTQTQLITIIGILYLMMFAMTWDVASGYTGQLNLGHAAFIAVGGYTTAILNITHGVSPLVSIPVAMVLSGLAGLAIGIPALRIRGAYLALVTLVIPTIFFQIVILFDGVFKGSFGFKSPPTSLAGTGGSTGALVTVNRSAMATIIDFYISYAVLLVLFLALFAYTRSDSGRILSAIREDEDAVVAAGIAPAKHKVFAFVLSAMTAGLAGALFVHSTAGFPHPDQLLADTLSLNIVIVSVLGGLGTIIGPMVGALLFGGLQFVAGEFDVALPMLEQTLSDVIPVVLFVLGMVVVYYRPEGLVPALLQRSEPELEDPTRRPSETAADGGTTPVEQVAEKQAESLPNSGQSQDNEY